jgi:serine/threonine-protein kinase HipA
MAELAVEVVVQIGGENVPAGKLWSHRRRNTESATFAYDDDYLTRPGAYELDPSLPLVTGQQQTPAGRAIFGAFSDCAPDRWGRRLINRMERQRVRREGGAERSFGEIDYLLGVRDDMRQGALRFRLPEDALYLADEEEGVPPLLELPRLLGAAERLERDEADEDELRMLLRGGSSLGGARPKAHVLDFEDTPAIAKFPSPADEWDVIRWEGVALTLAREAGIDVADSIVHLVDGKPVLVVNRFDRTGAVRIGYVSAMTMLEANDGDDGSYLDIVDVIERNSPDTERDLRELWRRIAFSILISNTDDHLRNHGFLRASSAGWTLAPAFDVNPNPAPGPKLLSTAIDFDDPTASMTTLIGVADYFRLDEVDVRQVLGETLSATSRWRDIAAQAHVDSDGIEQMAPAFEHEEADLAAQIVSDRSGESRSPA